MNTDMEVFDVFSNRKTISVLEKHFKYDTEGAVSTQKKNHIWLTLALTRLHSYCTCSMVNALKRAGTGEHLRASTRTVKPNTCTSFL